MPCDRVGAANDYAEMESMEEGGREGRVEMQGVDRRDVSVDRI